MEGHKLKKPLKVLSASALATALMASSLVPSAVVHADETKDVNFSVVVLEKDGNFFEIDKDVYFNEKLVGTKFAPFTIVKSSEGKYYKKDDFYNYKLLSDNLTEAFAALDEDASVRLSESNL